MPSSIKEDSAVAAKSSGPQIKKSLFTPDATFSDLKRWIIFLSILPISPSQVSLPFENKPPRPPGFSLLG